MPRRCSSLALMASVGPLDVPGRSKYARISVARCFRVCSSVVTSARGWRHVSADIGDERLQLIVAKTSIGVAVCFDHGLIDTPSGLNFSVLFCGEHVD